MYHALKVNAEPPVGIAAASALLGGKLRYVPEAVSKSAPVEEPRCDGPNVGAATGATKASAPSACEPDRKKAVSVGPAAKLESCPPATDAAGEQPRLDERKSEPGAHDAHDVGDAKYEYVDPEH